MLILILFALLVLILVSLCFTSFWLIPTRLTVLTNLFQKSLGSFPFSNYSFSLFFVTAFVFLLLMNLFSNVPFASSVTLYYFLTATMSVVIWLSLMSVVVKTQPNSFVAHLIPLGAPMFLAPILPLIELFSQLIRPFTLIVRLSTNLSAGHIMLFMFSYFSLSSLSISFVLLFLMSALLFLEVCISMLQAYIFVSLSFLYVEETL